MRAQRNMEELEKLLASISLSCLHLLPDQVSLEIERSLQTLGEAVRADRAYLADYDFAAGTLSIAAEWCRPGTSPQREKFQQFPFEPFIEGLEAHQRGEPFALAEVREQVPPEARELRGLEDTHSFLTVPVMGDAGCEGCVGFEYVRGPHVSSERELALLAVFARIVASVRQRIRYEHALLQSERRYRMLFNSNSDAIVVVDRERLITDCNPAFTDLFGYSREKVLGRTTEFLFDSPEEYLTLGERMRRHGDNSSILYEVRYRRKSGESFDGEKRLQHLRGEQGEICGFIATIRDVSLRKAAEAKIRTLLKEKEILMHEVHHRVKNNMGAISSLLALQADAVNEPAATVALEDARTRMQSMEVLYDKLYRAENLSELYLSDYLPALAQEILHAVPSVAAINLDTEGIEAVPAGVKLLSSLGMILNEIISNALKHAFPGRTSGSIVITTGRYNRDGEPDRLKIVVADDGQGIPDVAGPDQNRKGGFGFTLIRALTEQLQGTVLMERGNAGTGTRVVLDIPLE